MEKSILTAAVSLLLLTSGNVALSATSDKAILQSETISASGQAAGGHESVEELKAELAGLQSKLESTETGRSYLLNRLQDALGKSKAANAEMASMQDEKTDLLKSLRFMTDSRDYLMDELDSSKSMHEKTAMSSSAESDQQKTELERALKGREFLSGQSKRNREKLMAERKKNARLALALERANRGREYVKGVRDEAQSSAAEAEKENARLSLALERANRGRDYLIGVRDEARSSAASAEKENARLSLALERALRGRAYLKGENEKQALLLKGALQGREWYSSNAKKLEKEVQQLADISFSQINSAIAERDAARNMLNNTDWSDTLSSDLSASFANLDGTEVTTLANNSVAIKVGNTGLFSLGGTALSGEGKDLLGQIGSTLADRNDANIKIVGHTDNIPTGSGSRFANNEQLSLARATAALNYMTSIGVSAERLSVSGVGAAYPIASNDTEDGQLANRRVEIVLTPMK